MRSSGLVPVWLMDVWDSAVMWASGARLDAVTSPSGSDPESCPQSPRDPLDISLVL